MAIEHIGEGTFFDTELVDAPEGAPQANIYPYAVFRSLEHVSFGLMLCGRSCADDEIARQEVGQYGMEPLARYWEFREALRAIESERGRGGMFEDEPFVEVRTEREYKEALKALGLDESDFEGNGLYDFRDEPPTFVESVENYELEELERAADEALDFMFQGEEWEDVYRDLAEED